MEPIRQTPESLLAIQAELVAREPIFHRSEFGTTRQAFAAMTTEDFWEVGASGRRYSREFVLDTVEKRYATPHEDHWMTEDFYCQEIAAGLYLLTYTLKQGLRVSRRTTLWRKQSNNWVVVYHQGTLVAAP